MTRLCSLALLLLVYTACTKEPISPRTSLHPPMHYTNLEKNVKKGTYREVDIDADGHADFMFGTLLVGDPLSQQDKLQFYAYSKIGSDLLNNERDEAPMLTKDAVIPLQYPGYQWFELSAIVLAEKITLLNGAAYWQGLWKNAAHHYLPVQLHKGADAYLGWIDLSFDTTAQQLTLHRTAISREPGRLVTTGF